MCLGPALSALGLSCGKHGVLLNDLSSFNGVFLLFCVVRYWTKFFRSIARFFIGAASAEAVELCVVSVNGCVCVPCAQFMPELQVLQSE